MYFWSPPFAINQVSLNYFMIYRTAYVTILEIFK